MNVPVHLAEDPIESDLNRRLDAIEAAENEEDGDRDDVDEEDEEDDWPEEDPDQARDDALDRQWAEEAGEVDHEDWIEEDD